MSDAAFGDAHREELQAEDERKRREAGDRRAPVQGEHGRFLGTPGIPHGTIAWEEHLEAWQAYANAGFRDQSAERVAERGGFSVFEAEELLGRPLRTWRPR